MKLVGKYSFTLILFFVFAALAYWLLKQAPTTKEIVRAPSIVDVRFILADIKKQPISIVSSGRVTAAEVRHITRDVAGTVNRVNRRLVPGSYVHKNEILAEFENHSLILDVALKQAELDKALLNLTETKAKARIAKKGASKRATDFALYIPQLKSATSRVEANKAALEYSKLKLDNTVVKAPIDGKVIEVNMSDGEHIPALRQIIKLYGVTTGRVRLPLNDKQARLLGIKDIKNTSFIGPILPPIVEFTTDQKEDGLWQGYIASVEGERGSNQFIYAIAELTLQSNAQQDMPTQTLIPGSFVEATIQTPMIKSLTALPREVLRPQNRVWLIDTDNKVRSKHVNIVYKDQNYIYVDDGIEQGDQVVVSEFNKLIEGLVIHPVLNTSTATIASGSGARL